MNLSYRPIEEGDFPECARLAVWDPDCGPLDLPVLDAWRQLLTQGRLNGTVTEAGERPAGSRIVHFGVSAFVTDACLESVKAAPPTRLGRFIMARHLAGSPAILGGTEMRRANGGDGLNLVVLEHCYPMVGLTREQAGQVVALGPEAFIMVHRGYRLREILVQFPASYVQFALNSGFRVRDAATHLLGVTREEASAGSYVTGLFACHPIRLFLSAAEQQLLLRALTGETDNELAVALHLALPSVKSRWRLIYDRVGRHAPELLSGGEGAGGGHKRGMEKRRRLLHYLRQHPEELRPS